MGNVLVVGGPRTARQINDWFGKYPSAGYVVTGVWVPDDSSPEGSWIGSAQRRVPVLTPSRDIDEALVLREAAAVVVTDTEHPARAHVAARGQGNRADALSEPRRRRLPPALARRLRHADAASGLAAVRRGRAASPRASSSVWGAAGLMLVFSPLLLVTAALVKAVQRGAGVVSPGEDRSQR